LSWFGCPWVTCRMCQCANFIESGGLCFASVVFFAVKCAFIQFLPNSCWRSKIGRLINARTHIFREKNISATDLEQHCFHLMFRLTHKMVPWIWWRAWTVRSCSYQWSSTACGEKRRWPWGLLWGLAVAERSYSCHWLRGSQLWCTCDETNRQTWEELPGSSSQEQEMLQIERARTILPVIWCSATGLDQGNTT